MGTRAADSRAVRLREAQGRLAEFLKQRGLRATRQRDAVLEVFLDAGAHVSAEQLYDRLRAQGLAVGFATVYRSMSLFVDAGIAKERRFHEGCVRYEPGVDVDHHDHLVCVCCGAIEEFEDPTIERIQQEIAAKRRFEVRYHRLELYGRCARCAAKA